MRQNVGTTNVSVLHSIKIVLMKAFQIADQCWLLT